MIRLSHLYMTTGKNSFDYTELCLANVSVCCTILMEIIPKVWLLKYKTKHFITLQSMAMFIMLIKQ